MDLKAKAIPSCTQNDDEKRKVWDVEDKTEMGFMSRQR